MGVENDLRHKEGPVGVDLYKMPENIMIRPDGFLEAELTDPVLVFKKTKTQGGRALRIPSRYGKLSPHLPRYREIAP